MQTLGKLYLYTKVGKNLFYFFIVKSHYKSVHVKHWRSLLKPQWCQLQSWRELDCLNKSLIENFSRKRYSAFCMLSFKASSLLLEKTQTCLKSFFFFDFRKTKSTTSQIRHHICNLYYHYFLSILYWNMELPPRIAATRNKIIAVQYSTVTRVSSVVCGFDLSVDVGISRTLLILAFANCKKQTVYAMKETYRTDGWTERQTQSARADHSH